MGLMVPREIRIAGEPLREGEHVVQFSDEV